MLILWFLELIVGFFALLSTLTAVGGLYDGGKAPFEPARVDLIKVLWIAVIALHVVRVL